MSCHDLIISREAEALVSSEGTPPKDKLITSILGVLEVDSRTSGTDRPKEEEKEEEEDEDILTTKFGGEIRGVEQETGQCYNDRSRRNLQRKDSSLRQHLGSPREEMITTFKPAITPRISPDSPTWSSHQCPFVIGNFPPEPA